MLDDTLRAELQKPFGDVCSEENCTEKLTTYKTILTVGDITTYRVMVSGIVPDICIIDGITMRRRVPDTIRDAINSEPRTVYEVDNPPGTISRQLINAVSRAVSKISLHERARIVVHGEEDLAVIPAVMAAPEGTAVVYGQPNEGMVIIAVTAEKQQDAEHLLRKIQKATLT
ncbi:MAG: GTP-dependent dephospho-CoA kinase family protein [Euryarchaeota archaeon]|nr:GTP-dependent dephospho-CoA kinase family protein [Euryarchaeota archaeon]